jgi:predicted transcriptional regulator
MKNNITSEALQNEYNYVLAQQITKRLLEAGLITKDEFNKITAKNHESFSPVLAGIMPKLT